jgi:hypothetical protein
VHCRVVSGKGGKSGRVEVDVQRVHGENELEDQGRKDRAKTAATEIGIVQPRRADKRQRIGLDNGEGRELALGGRECRKESLEGAAVDERERERS